jgi:multidrug efflux pump subunit AcrA (membrane-fusion protein)
MSQENQHIEDIQIRSDEVQEIMSHVPNWMIRWGISLFFGIIVLFLFLAWLIKYPDVISGTATLTTSTPPVKLVVKSSGEIDKLLISDNQTVESDQTIASIESTLSDEAHLFLLETIENIKQADKLDALEDLELTEKGFVFGELQTSYSTLKTAIQQYRSLLVENNIPFTIQNTKDQIAHQSSLLSLVTKQTTRQSRLLKNAKEKFNSDKTLYEKDVISQADFFDREKTYENMVNSVEELEKSKIQISITLTQLRKELNELSFNFEKEKRKLLLDIRSQTASLESQLSGWKRSYQLTSPIDGRLTYLQDLSENQFIEQGKEIFAIIPDNQNYIAQLKIPKTGFGKVKLGQTVMLKLDNYPHFEYGQIKGEVKSIALLPNEDSYLVKVVLKEGLKTNYNRTLQYKPEMSGTAEIITEDLRITDRIFNQFRDLF